MHQNISIMMSTTVSTICFDAPLSRREIVFFRGALLKFMGEKADVSCHNHTGDGFKYGYPQVQYKLVGGKAAIVVLGDIYKSLVDELSVAPIHLSIGNRGGLFRIDEVSSKRYTPVVDDTPKHYSLTNYLPLTDKNFSTYNKIVALTDKICFIENIIVGNILSFLKGISFKAEEEIHVAITELTRKPDSVYKGVAFRTYDVKFVSNIELPDNIGLGKSASVGHGLLSRLK